METQNFLGYMRFAIACLEKAILDRQDGSRSVGKATHLLYAATTTRTSRTSICSIPLVREWNGVYEPRQLHCHEQETHGLVPWEECESIFRKVILYIF